MRFFKKYWIGFPIGILTGGLLVMIIQARTGMTGNQATINAGLLGLIGGIIGAMAAFFIAKMQLNLQIREQENSIEKQFENQKDIMKLQLEKQFEQQKKIMLEQTAEQQKLGLEKIKIEVEVQNIRSVVIELSTIRNISNRLYNCCNKISVYEKYSESKKRQYHSYFNEDINEFRKELDLLDLKIGEYIQYTFLYVNNKEYFNSFYNNLLVNLSRQLELALASVLKNEYTENTNFMEVSKEALLNLKKRLEEEIGDFNQRLLDTLNLEIDKEEKEC